MMMMMLLILVLLVLIVSKCKCQQEKAMISLQLGNDYYKNGDIDAAIDSYRQAIVHDPEYIHAYSNLGNALKDKGLYEESIAVHTASIKLDPANYKLHYNVGVSFQMSMEYEQAITAYSNALSLNPNHVNTNYNYGLTLQELGQIEEAMIVYMTVLKLDPYHISARLNYCNILMALKSSMTERCYLDVLTIDSSNVKGIINLASFYQSQVDYDDSTVKNLYQKAIEIDPTNVMANKALQSISGDGTSTDSKLDASYVRELFDSYSFIFEDSLMKLKYNSHELIAMAVERYSKEMTENIKILDLGAGTGLACPVLREKLSAKFHCEIDITGVDISTKMLALAEKKRCYNRTVSSDIVHYVEEDKNLYNIIIAADVFVYIGDLQKLFSSCRTASLPNSLFVFTVENGDVDDSKMDDFYVQLSGRYGHKKKYLVDLARATGWKVIDINEVSGREDKGQPIPGYLLVLESNE